jgi:hypothetical protein
MVIDENRVDFAPGTSRLNEASQRKPSQLNEFQQ